MIVIPAVDLRGGYCVQLVGGDYADERVRLDVRVCNVDAVGVTLTIGESEWEPMGAYRSQDDWEKQREES